MREFWLVKEFGIIRPSKRSTDPREPRKGPYGSGGGPELLLTWRFAMRCPVHPLPRTFQFTVKRSTRATLTFNSPKNLWLLHWASCPPFGDWRMTQRKAKAMKHAHVWNARAGSASWCQRYTTIQAVTQHNNENTKPTRQREHCHEEATSVKPTHRT